MKIIFILQSVIWKDPRDPEIPSFLIWHSFSLRRNNSGDKNLLLGKVAQAVDK